MIALLQKILPLLDPLDAIAKQIAKAYIEAQNAETEQQRIAAEERIKQLEARRDILLTEQGQWYTAMIRPLFAAPLIIYYWKTIVWDKVLALGTTDPLTGSIGEWAGVIIAAYFVARPIEKIGTSWLSRLRKG